eukprot:COSAG06_NODE_1940_length_8023_cov_11.932988_4_plen_126_part_00
MLPSNLNLYDDKVVDYFWSDGDYLHIQYVDENKDADMIEVSTDHDVADENDIISTSERDYEEMNDTAATTIQAAARGMLGRLFVKKEQTAVRIIQAAARNRKMKWLIGIYTHIEKLTGSELRGTE